MVALVVVGSAVSAQAAAPSVPTSGFETLQLTSQRPVLAAEVSDPDGGSVTAKFFAKTVGSATYDLADGSTVAVTSGDVARLKLASSARIGAAISWQVQACDATACSASSAVQTATISPLLGAGARPGATRVSFPAGDRVSAQVDVGTGNLLVQAQTINLAGVNAPVSLPAAYNSLAAGATTTPGRFGRGWSFDVGDGVHLEEDGDGSVTYHGPGGLTGLFVPVSGSTTDYTSPAGFKVDLIRDDATLEWKLTDHGSGTVRAFDSSGELTAVKDRNANATTIAYGSYAGGAPVELTITSPAGPSYGRVATLTSDAYRNAGLDQANGVLSRSVAFAATYDDLTSITDTEGRATTFTYSVGHDLTKITAPGGVETSFTYDSSHRVTSITQKNTAAGGPGTSITRLSYASTAQTLLADPNTDQGATVASVPHTTYTIDTTARVTSVVDAAGRTRARTYTANFDVASKTLGTGATSGTTTNTFGANSGESRTGTQAPGGASNQAAYSNTGDLTKYLPSSATDDAGNSTTYTYNGAGNPTQASDASAAESKVSYNSDGTAATATGPANGTNSTGYGYNANHQLTSITPVTGTSLGSRAFTYDGFGRISTSTNGRSVTSTYTYDDLDRISDVTYTGGAVVSYTYDSAGRVATRTDANGTTTYSYDTLNRLTSRVNTYGGGTIYYGYDKASNLVSVSDTRGTTNYLYDDGQALTAMTYLRLGAIRTTRFAVDDQGRRTDTWLQTNTDNTVFAARSHTDYDTSGRVTRIYGDRGPSSTSYTRTTDRTFCYAAGSTAPACSSSTSADRSKIRWIADSVTGLTTTYGYDTQGRLTTAAVTGGTNPRTYTYGYDSRGNRTSTAVTGSSPASSTRTFNAGNQITTTGHTYDGAGNLTAQPGQAMTYNSADQQASVTIAGVATAYTYAGSDQNELLNQATPSGDNYSYIYGRTDQHGLPVIEKVKRGTITAHIDHDPTGTPIMLRYSSGTVALYIYDGRGNPIGLITEYATTGSAYDYDPYGVQTLTAGSPTGLPVLEDPFTYEGGTRDRVTGQIKYGQRWYDPDNGRFTQQDTLDAPLDPANANRYAYAGADPINNADPTGQLSDDTIGVSLCALGGIALGLASAGVGAGVALACIGIDIAAEATE